MIWFVSNFAPGCFIDQLFVGIWRQRNRHFPKIASLPARRIDMNGFCFGHTELTLVLQYEFSAISVTNADCVGHIGDENLSVSDFSSSGSRSDGRNRRLKKRGANEQFELDFGHKIYFVLRSPINFAMAFLTAVTADLGDCQTLNSDCIERFLNGVKFERLYDRLNFFHLFAF